MNTHELREAFQRFFEEREHRRVPGAPIVPPGDPTLLFNSAGMVQFKPYFTGQSRPPHVRLTSVQKCFRTTDIESVGDTKHLTFFEMLGNFSIGDYFKTDMVPWAWEFVTEVLKLPPDRLWASVYLDDDEAYQLWRMVGVPEERIKRYGEEENYWFSGEIGPCGPCSEIYYDFGEQFGCGPECQPSHECGRFLEIWNLVFMSFYCDGDSRTPLPSKNIDTGSGLERVATVLRFESEDWDKKRLATPYDTDVFARIIHGVEELSGKRYGEDEKIDRAIRIVAEHARAVTFLIGDERTPVVPSNEERGYVVRRMLRRAVYFGRRQLGIEEPFMMEIADVVVDTMAPSYPELERQRAFVKETIGPEERRFHETLSRGSEMLEHGLIPLRRHLQEAIKPAVEQFDIWLASKNAVNLMRDLGQGPLDGVLKATEPLSGSVVEGTRPLKCTVMERLIAATGGLSQLVTLPAAGKLYELRDWLRDWQLQSRQTQLPTFDESDFRSRLSELESSLRTISGEEAFELHDTYGFPIELTREIATENDFGVDEARFQEEMKRQRERARAATDFERAAVDFKRVAIEAIWASLPAGGIRFVGYEALEANGKVLSLVVNKEILHLVEAPSAIEIVVDRTPFYPEGGGQVGDRGEIVGPSGRMLVEDTQRVAERMILHRGRVIEGQISVGDEVTARVDAEHRADTMRNHTATHLLHAALRKVLGSHVRQAGSLVAPDHLRFDFTHTEAVSREQLVQVERLVNEKIRQNLPVHTRHTTFKEAMDEGVLAFFGDKYGEEVRVVEVNTVVPRFSAELCGGTHCERTGDIGLVIVTGESSIGSGMRRIEALSGRGAHELVRQRLDEIEEALRRLGGARGALLPRIDTLVAERDALAKKVERMEKSLASVSAMDQIVDRAVDVDGVTVLSSQVDLPSMDALRYSADAVRKAMPSGVAVLGSVIDGLPKFVAMVSQDVIPKGPKAGEILKRVAAVAGGGAGGRPDMAQGGGKDPSKIDAALAIVPETVREMLSGDGRSGEG